MVEKPILPVRDTALVQRGRIFVDHGRNLSRGGRAIDQNAPSTMELAIDIGERGQLMPVSVRTIPARIHAKDEGGADQNLRLVSGYRRITAMDLLHKGATDYMVLVVYSNATTEFEELLECFAENHVVPPKDFEVAEGISLLRTQYGLSEDLAIQKIFGQGNMRSEGAKRARKCLDAWEGLITPLRELWKKNTPYFQLEDDRVRGYWGANSCAHKTPLEQEEFLEHLVNPKEEDPIKAKIGGGAAVGPATGEGQPEKPIVIRRPTKRHINQALLSLKRSEADTHNDGLAKGERAFAWKLFRWLLAIPVNGKKPRCPIRLRRAGGVDAPSDTDAQEFESFADDLPGPGPGDIE